MVRTRFQSDRDSFLQPLESDEILDPNIRRLALLTTAGPEPLQPVSRRTLATTLAHRRAYPFQSSNTATRPSHGHLHLGTTSTGQPYALDEALLSKHLLTVGQSGAGKTTLFSNLLTQLDVPFWSFDLKQDYRHLLTELDDLLVLPWTELKFNPLVPPPGVAPRRWVQVVSEIFGHATALLSGSKNHLLKILIELYRLYDLFEDCSPPYPSFHELRQLLETEKINYVRKTANYRDTLLNRIEAMTLVAGSVFDCSHGYSLDELLERNVVFEFDGVSRDVQTFLMEILFAAVYEYRLAQNQRSTPLNHVFVLDEAKQVFSVYKERQDAAGIPEIDALTAKMREFGEGLIVGDQEASKLTDSIKANTATKLLLPTGDRKQFEAMAGSMHLTDRQRTVAQQLDIGEAVVQTGNDDPVRVNLDNYSVSKEVTDAELRRQQSAAWADLSVEPRERTPQFEQVLGVGPDETESVDIIEDPPTETSLSADADQLLIDVIENPFRSLTERYAEFPSRYAGNNAKTELVEQGLVRERSVPQQTGAMKLLELTEQGRTYVENMLDRDPTHDGRGSITHRYWQHQVQSAFTDAGWPTKLELFDADVYVNLHAFELLIEIAMENTQREYDHVKQHFDSGFEVVWVVCPSESVRDGLQERFESGEIDTDNVVFRLTSDFLDSIGE